MGNRDKDNILIFLYIAILVGLAIGVYVLKDKIQNVLVPFGILMAVQQLYVIPKFIQKYRALYGVETGLVRFLPVYNETLGLSSFFANSYLVLTGLLVLSVIGIFIDPNLVAKILPHEAVLNFSNMAIYAFILLLILQCALRGAGYCQLIYDIQSQNENYTGTESNLWDVTNIVSYVTVFIPGMRVLGLMYQLSTLTKLVDMNGYVVDFQEEDEDIDYYDC